MWIRKAKSPDSEEIAKTLISFYNIEDLEEAKNIFLNETKKAIVILSLVKMERLLVW